MDVCVYVFSNYAWLYDTPSVMSSFNGCGLTTDDKIKHNFFKYLDEKNECYVIF